MEQAIQEKHRKRWSREETMGFLRCYLTRKAEFEHSKKKRLAYANVLEDMVSLGITDSDKTPLCLESKMRSLLTAYKAARDNNRSTGASPCFAPYMELMEEIFGTSPIISNDHTLHVSYRSFETALTASSPQQSSSTTTAPSPYPSSSTTPDLSPHPSSSLVSTPSPTSSPSSPSSSVPIARKKRSAREVFYEKKLKLRKMEGEVKNKARSKAIEELKDMLREKWQKDSELESRKLALLEKIANRN